MHIFFSRSIRNPFQRGFSTKVTFMLIIIIYIVALLLNFNNFYYMSYENISGHEFCFITGNSDMLFAKQLIDPFMISFIPLPIIVTLHVLSYRAIVQSAERFELDTNRVRTMKKVRRTFCIVIVVFFLLTSPSQAVYFTLTFIWKFYPHLTPKYTVLRNLDIFLNLLLSFNSCANPFIYAKLHRRFSRCLCCIRRRLVQGRSARAAYVVELQQM